MTQRRRPHSNARRAVLAATAVVALAIACNAPVPTSPHPDDSRDVPLTSASKGLVTPGDTVLYYVDGLLATKMLLGKLQSDSLRLSDGAKFKVTLDPVNQDVRKRVEYWLTSVMAKERAAVGHVDARTAGAVDRPVALHAKIESDSALRASIIQLKHNGTFAGRVLVDGQPKTMLYLKQLPPELIKSVDAMRHTDSTSVLSVITKDH